MKIGVFGLGFVGTVVSGCLADSGHELIGVDVDSSKVGLFGSGLASISEPEIEGLLARAHAAGRIDATLDVDDAVARSDLSLVCVDVSTRPDASQDTTALEVIVTNIGAAIAKKHAFHSVVVRSTVLPGTTRRLVLPILERAVGKTVGVGFGLAHNPEFMREGSGITDFRNASRTIIGELDAQTAEMLADAYRPFGRRVFRTTPELAEAAKYADNAWHAVKVSFANEIATICNAHQIDSNVLFDMFCADTQLNISSAYLKPGFGFGGSCLSKDVRAIVDHGRRDGLDLPLLSSIEASNRRHIQRSIDWLIASGQNRFALLGLAYKKGTDDLRESPFVRIALALRGAGKDVRAFDPYVAASRRSPAHSGYRGSLLDVDGILTDDLPDLVAWSDTLLVCTYGQEYSEILSSAGPDKVILDFANSLDIETAQLRIRKFV